MKRFLSFTATLLCATSAFAQGTVFFNNKVGTILRAPFYGCDPVHPFEEKHGNTADGIPAGTQVYGGAPLAGTGFTVQLWGKVGAGVPFDSLELLATTTFRTGAAAGFVNTASLPGGSSDISVPNAPLTGTPLNGTFQIRVWDNLGGSVTTWDQVIGNPGVVRGFTEVVTAGPLGGTGTPPATSAILIGITSFELFSSTCIPEPSSVALALCSASAVFLLRRRRRGT